MEAEVNKECVYINKLVCEKRELIFVEEDMIVPDSKPDILKVINTTGSVYIYKKEVLDGRIKLDGAINSYIMYLPDSDTELLRGLNLTINFSKVIQVEEAKEGMDLKLDVNIKDIECKVLNGRKINVKAGIQIDLKIYSNEEIELISKVNNINHVQTLEKDFEINSLIGQNSTRVYIKDTFNIDSQDEILEVLKTEIGLCDNDLKISYNKVLSKCELEVKILYLNKDGRIGRTKGKIPAVGFIDIQNVTEENICEASNEIKNILIRPNSPEEHSIYVEAEIESSCKAYEKKKMTIIQDLYSPVEDLNYSKRKITTTTDKISKTKNFTISNKSNISELVDGNLIDVDARVDILKENISDSKISYEGELSLNYIFENAENNINSKVSKEPFEVSIDNPLDSKNIKLNTQCMLLNKRFDVKTGGDIDYSIDIECITDLTKDTSMDIINNVVINESRAPTDDYDSLILYIVMPGDTLWKIAKRFKSTVEDIVITNGIEDENKIYPGQKLYIPKFSYSDANIITNTSTV